MQDIQWINRDAHPSDALRGIAAGMLGGLVASWTMNQFQALWSRLSQRGGQQPQQQKPEDQQEEDATMKTASALSEKFLHRPLTREQKKIAGPLVHYVYGTLIGGLYGAAAEVMPAMTSEAGLLFGTAVWLGGDEAALPLLGLSKPPTQYPLSTHANALAAHFVYGLTADRVRRIARRALASDDGSSLRRRADPVRQRR